MFSSCIFYCRVIFFNASKIVSVNIRNRLYGLLTNRPSCTQVVNKICGIKQRRVLRLAQRHQRPPGAFGLLQIVQRSLRSFTLLGLLDTQFLVARSKGSSSIGIGAVTRSHQVIQTLDQRTGVLDRRDICRYGNNSRPGGANKLQIGAQQFFSCLLFGFFNRRFPQCKRVFFCYWLLGFEVRLLLLQLRSGCCTRFFFPCLKLQLQPAKNGIAGLLIDARNRRLGVNQALRHRRVLHEVLGKILGFKRTRVLLLRKRDALLCVSNFGCRRSRRFLFACKHPRFFCWRRQIHACLLHLVFDGRQTRNTLLFLKLRNFCFTRTVFFRQRLQHILEVRGARINCFLIRRSLFRQRILTRLLGNGCLQLLHARNSRLVVGVELQRVLRLCLPLLFCLRRCCACFGFLGLLLYRQLPFRSTGLGYASGCTDGRADQTGKVRVLAVLTERFRGQHIQARLGPLDDRLRHFNGNLRQANASTAQRSA